ncbi:MAG TPA: AmmeMemoRadiSam system protein B [Thermodesulfovibrionales bacterium]|nr:AmmeMemoRadiSam system protein B [Thermodesulfovibrionales bacterium]
MRRKPAVAGQFYQGAAAKLVHQVGQYLATNLAKEHAIGILSPHAGLIYSGAVAGEVYSRIIMPQTFLLIGPNHTGLGADVALVPQGEWEIPTAVMQIDERLARRILANASMVSEDAQAHIFEHSLEVQLPFIAYLSKDAAIVPIAVKSASLEECRLLGEGIAKSIKESGSSVVIVASSDMSHYVTAEMAKKKDEMALDRVLSLDPEGLFNVVRKERISMCGYLPAIIMLYAAKSLGAGRAKLVRYATSAEVSGDYDHVVGYAGMIIS